MEETEFSPIKITKESSAETLKELILYIITATEFVNKFESVYSFSQLRKSMSAYFRQTAKPTSKEPRKQGGIDNAQKLKSEVDVQGLINVYGNIKDDITPITFRDIARCLDYNIDDNGHPESQLDSYIDRIDWFTFCKFQVVIKFQKIHEFAWSFTEESEPTSPVVEDFVKAKQILSKCEISLIGKPKLLQRGEGSSTDSVKEYYIGHYLNFDQKPLLSFITLEWKNGQLVSMRLKQKEDFFGKDGIEFVNTPNGIQNSVDENPIFVVLRNDKESTPNHVTTAQYQQITLEKECRKGIRCGSFSTVLYSIVNRKIGREYIPVSGLMILQLVNDELDLHVLSENVELFLKDLPNESLDNTYQELVLDTISIRYRLQNKLISLVPSIGDIQVDSWNRLKMYAGRYVCQYMRLSKSPARFETSRIQLFADGTATLRQREGEQEFTGYVRVDGDRLWIYFGYSDITGKEFIRFIVDKGASSGELVFRGIFSSQTMTDKRLVSGRMLMRPISNEEPWPEPFSVEYRDVNYNHIPNKEDRKFFTEELNINTNLTDGPIWADVANRLQNHSALNLIEQICTDKSLNNKAFNRNQFYYYTFKTDSTDEEQFFIQRDLVTFYPNGTVTINAADIIYEGYAYHSHKTLRLSLSNPEHGFLEVFLEVLADIADRSTIKILYGMSLWRAGSRLQGKTVVLSRLEPGPMKAQQENFYFLSHTDNNFKSAIKRLNDEDRRAGGAISYLRGQINRYMHATTNSSHSQFRPRDQRFREMHFLIACYYGFQSKTDWPLSIPIESDLYDKWLKTCQDHLKEAFIHGYACDFASINIKVTGGIPTFREVEDAYHRKFPTAKRNNNKTTEIINRIRQITREQRFLIKAFSEGGPLDNAQLREFAQHYWPKLL